MTVPIHNKVGFTVLKLAKEDPCATANSLGSIMRCSRLFTLRKSTPKIIPTKIIRARSLLFLLSVRNNRSAPSNISNVSKANLPATLSCVNPIPPKRNSKMLCTNKYKESKPKMLGVRIGLLVKVWNSNVDMPMV